jgi:hypothetical protein
MNAMTWYDHETTSIWSQPWGRAIRGQYKGVELNLLPFQLTTWVNWKKAYPDTQVMADDLNRIGRRRQGFQPDFVIGLVLGGNARAYYYEDVIEVGAINDVLGEVPVVVWASGEIYNAYIRQVDDQKLTFRSEGETLIDQETGSVWDLVRGLAISGPLKGSSLRAVPSLSSFDWAWEDFYPDSEFYSS